MDEQEVDRILSRVVEQRWPQEIEKWQKQHQTFMSRREEIAMLVRLAFFTGLELAARVIDDEPELPGPMPRAYEELSREELCRRAVRATKRLTVARITNIASSASKEANHDR